MQSYLRCRSALFATLAALILSPAAGSGPAAASTTVNGIRLGTHPDGVTRVVMDVSGSMTFRISHRDAPYRVVIETDDLAWKAKPAGPGQTGPISGLHHERSDGASQVIIELQQPAVVKKAFMLSPDEGMGWRFVMDIKTTSDAGFQAVAASGAAPRTIAKVTPPEVVQAAPAPVVTPIPQSTPASLDEPAARALVQAAIDDILGAFAGKPMKREDVQATMGSLVSKYADMRLESQQILGRYWTRATPEQQREFQGLLEKFLTKAVSGMVDEIPADQSIVIKGVERSGESFIVRTQASVPGEPNVEVKWVVMTGSAGRPVITDVSTDGAAVIATLQADFTSVVRNAASRGIDALFEPLRKKINGTSS